MSSDRMFRPNEEQLELLKRWYAPDVAEPVIKKATNAFGMTAEDIVKPKIQPRTTESIEQESAQITAEELEKVRQSAQQEGFEQGYNKGYEAGLVKGHDEGYQQGHEQGQSEGQQQGYNEGKLRLDSQLTMLNKLITQLSNALDNQEQQIEQALLSLALEVAKKIVHTEVQQSPQPIIQAISEGIKLLASNEPILIRLNPQDIKTGEEMWTSEQLVQRNLVLESDLTLPVGSCSLESKISTVTLDLASRIDQVFDDFYSQPKPQLEQDLQEAIDPAQINEYDDDTI